MHTLTIYAYAYILQSFGGQFVLLARFTLSSCLKTCALVQASGHVDRFNDFMVKDLKDESKYFRADKLLEEAMENIIKDPKRTPEEKDEAKKVAAQADGFTGPELGVSFFVCLISSRIFSEGYQPIIFISLNCFCKRHVSDDL